MTGCSSLRAGRLLLLMVCCAPALAVDPDREPAGPETIAILPSAIRLIGTEARQRVLLERQSASGEFVGAVESDDVTWEIEDPAIARIDGRTLTPLANGQTKLIGRWNGLVAEATVEVTAQDQPFEWSFRHHVQSILAKQGCNSGACHGAAAGKKGFKLSLRGYDAPGDYDVLRRQAVGRRLNLAEPAKSLLLTKPTVAVPHAGGKRLDVDSREYRAIAQWIAAGARPPTAEDASIERIEILPAGVLLGRDGTQPLIVQAHFSDGRVEDVTAWAKFTSAQADVVEVDDAGMARVVGHGEGAISAWYLNKIALARVTVPYPSDVDPTLFANAPTRNFIDERILAKLERLNLPPSPRCSDETFVRRVYLDVLGVLPTPEESRVFLADPSPDKRDRLIDELFERPEFVDLLTYKLSDLLLVSSARLQKSAMWKYSNWIRENVAINRPWDEMVRELITAEGHTLENGATNFFVLHQDTRLLTETVSVAFMGLSINCARCHNHPLERWTNDEYFGFANMLSRVRRKGTAGDGAFVVYVAPTGDLTQPLRGKPQVPRPLDGESLPIDAPADRRVELARWLTAPENPYFARAIANRLWAHLMGVGLVEPVDDLRLTNPPSNGELLNDLADDLVANGYDLRHLLKRILQSESYQRSSLPEPASAGDRRFYARYYPRRLMAEVLMDVVSQVTGVPTPFAGYPSGWRAVQLPDSQVASSFLEKFGRAPRDQTCECERSNAPSVVQALHIANSSSINEKLSTKGNRIDDWLSAGLETDALIDQIYLVTLTRLPDENERTAIRQELESAKPEDRRAILEDLLWSLVSSKEFMFHH